MMFIVTPIVIIAVFFVIALSRGATVDSMRLGNHRLTIKTSLSPELAFARGLSARAPFGVADSDEATQRLVLTTKPTFATWGFFYPIEIHADASGGSRIEIGIKSRLFQWGPLVTKWHRKCRDEIEQILGSLPEARVVAS